MKLFHSKIEYGFKALSFLANHKSGYVFNARIIAERLQIPREYTSKILQGFARQGILVSKKGKNGGFLFIKDPKTITIREVLVSLDVDLEPDKCLLGFQIADYCEDCLINTHWNLFTNGFNTFMSQNSIEYITSRH
jgi:Rrf2 family protein